MNYSQQCLSSIKGYKIGKIEGKKVYSTNEYGTSAKQVGKYELPEDYLRLGTISPPDVFEGTEAAASLSSAVLITRILDHRQSPVIKTGNTIQKSEQKESPAHFIINTYSKTHNKN